MKKLLCFLVAACLFAEPYEFTEQQVLDYNHGVESELADLEPILSSDFFVGAKTVLDVGCGDGKLLQILAHQFPTISFVGSDVSKNMIEFAKKHYPAPNLTYVIKDASHLGYEEEFDRIVSFSTMHWIKDQKVAFRSLYQALKPGGRVFVRATPKTSHNDYKTICMNVIMSFKWMTQFMGYKSDSTFHSERDYKKFLTSIGYQVDLIEQKNHETVIRDKPMLNTFLKGVLTLLTHLPENKRDAFLDDYYDELVKNGNVDEQGAIHFRFDRVEMLLSKL